MPDKTAVSQRERDILELLADDLTVGEVGIVLMDGSSAASVRMEVHRLRLKLGVRTTHCLILAAERAGLLAKRH